MRKAKLHESVRGHSRAWWAQYLCDGYAVLATEQGLRRPLTSAERRGFRQYVQRYLNKRGWVGSASAMAAVYHALRFDREAAAERTRMAKVAAAKRKARVA